MIDIQKLSEAILAQAVTLASQIIGDYQQEAKADIAKFVEDSKSDLANWTQALAAGQLSKDDFNDLVATNVLDAVFHGIKRAGLKEVAMDKFKAGLIRIITEVAFSMVSAATKG